MAPTCCESGIDVLVEEHDSSVASGADRYAFFVQDQWWVTGSTTIEGGIRYGQERRPGLPAESEGAWQPRLGGAWSPPSSRLAVRAAYRGLGDGLHHSTAGVQWQWMPRVAVSFNYLDVRDDAASFRGVTAELYRRFAQSVHYRVSYTFGSNEGAVPGVPALLPRQRLAASVIYNTSVRAAAYDGLVRLLVKDWTVSAILVRDSLQSSFDPRVARDIALGDNARVTLFWEALNLFDSESAATRRLSQLAARVSF